MKEAMPMIVALIAAFAPALAVIIALWRTKTIANTAVESVKASVLEIHLSLNSRLDKMMKLAEAVAFDAGVKFEKDKNATKEVAFDAGVQSEKDKIIVP
jgi:hypothetical protein